MADMLVKLYNINSFSEQEDRLLEHGVRIKRALAPDKSKIVEFAQTCSNEDYSDEVEIAFSNHPITCYIATKEKKIIGFACFGLLQKIFLDLWQCWRKREERELERHYY